MALRRPAGIGRGGVSSDLRQRVRGWYRATLSGALAAVTLVALLSGGFGPHADVEEGEGGLATSGGLESRRVGSRELLNALAVPMCSSFPDEAAIDSEEEADEARLTLWRTSCCELPPPNKDDLEAWWKACRDTDFLSGNPYLSCLKKWYGGAKDCKNSDNELCSLKAHCSDMGVYQALGLQIGEAGFHPAMAIPYLMCLLYLFMALAVVCDEYFVPAIDEISEVWSITPDVAGATLMAAGGSAPELATSFMGVFVSKSDVGFSTIVGSAVFNVLFVIGACAFASKQLLTLTAWPLARDCCYYSMTLCMLAIVYQFGPESESGGPTIEAWEAVIMLILYIGYVSMMKFNSTLESAFNERFGSKKVDDDGGETGGQAPEEATAKEDDDQHHWTTFRMGILDVLMKNRSVDQILGMQAVAKISGDVKATFDTIDVDRSGFIDAQELVALLKQILHYEPTNDQVEDAMKSLVTLSDDEHGGKSKVSYEEFESWYQKSELSVESEMNSLFKKMDESGDGNISHEEFDNFCKEFYGNQKISEDEMKEGLKMLKDSTDGKVSIHDFASWYKGTAMFKDQVDHLKNGGEEEEDGGASLEFPEDLMGRFWYVVLFPINGTLYFTVPDVRWKNGWEKWYPVTFFMSIIWIAIYAFFMVFIAIAFGDAIGIPQSVMGLTILAMGTSVPDMISSVIVTLHGEGDMAVSSSIGSNIFDIGFGLPLPWLLGVAAYGDGIELGAGCTTIFIDLLLLLGMVLAVVATVHLSGWKLSKPLGITMFCLYFVFIAQSLLRTFLVKC